MGQDEMIMCLNGQHSPAIQHGGEGRLIPAAGLEPAGRETSHGTIVSRLWLIVKALVTGSGLLQGFGYDGYAPPRAHRREDH